jgi:hypothetical protein
MGKTQMLLNEAEVARSINRMSMREASVGAINRGERQQI